MRVLIFNWVPFDDVEKRGGGVTVYIANLIETLVAAGHDVITVSSGTDYDLLRKRPRVRRIANIHGGRVRSYSIVNSEVCAPGHSVFGDNDAVFAEGGSVDCFRSIVRREWPVDVVHFNNLEGISAEVLALKREFASTKFIYSAHNYFALCPQVNLWRHEEMNCPSMDGGRSCIDCVPRPRTIDWKLAYAVSRKLVAFGCRPGSFVYRSAFGWLGVARQIVERIRRPLSRLAGVVRRRGRVSENIVGHELSKSLRTRAGSFVGRRMGLVRLINSNCDLVHAVSQRTRDILVREGIDAAKLWTGYIGTKVAAQVVPTQRRRNLARDGEVHIAFLGYMRRDKGFYFLLDALEQLDLELATRISLTVAARMSDEAAFRRLEQLGFRLKSVTHYDGYSHADLDVILRDVDVGVVPVLWEDNLPQVAIEMVSKGRPIITSDLGGAQELCDNKAFVFEAGCVDGFAAVLSALTTGTLTLDEFWTGGLRLPTVKEAMMDLLDAVLRTGPLRQGAEGHQGPAVRSQCSSLSDSAPSGRATIDGMI